MGVTERRAREREALRRTILDAASQLFAEQGYRSVTIRKLAERIEYSPSTIYLYFKDKAALLAAIVTETFEGLNRRMAQLRTLGLPPLQTLEFALRGYIQFGLDHPSHYVATFAGPWEPAEHPAPDHERMRQVGIESFNGLRDRVAEAMEAGVIEKSDIQVAAQSIWMACHGTIELLIQSQNDRCFPWADRDQVIDFTVRMILRGIGAKAHPINHAG
jgi:AcrR family transcriptional regulator